MFAGHSLLYNAQITLKQGRTQEWTLQGHTALHSNSSMAMPGDAGQHQRMEVRYPPLRMSDTSVNTPCGNGFLVFT